MPPRKSDAARKSDASVARSVPAEDEFQSDRLPASEQVPRPSSSAGSPAPDQGQDKKDKDKDGLGPVTIEVR